MEVKTFTNFWNMERKLYAIYDISLPVPISLKVVGAFMITALPWWGLLILLHVPFSFVPPTYLIWLLVPVPLSFLASRPIYQRKSIFQFALSMFRFMRQPKRLAGLRKPNYKINETYNVKSKVFTREPIMKEQ